MKRTLLRTLALGVLVLLSGRACAQYSKLKGSTAAQVGVGFVDAGILINYYYIKTFDKKIKASFGGGFIGGKVADINYKSVFLDGAATFGLYDNRFFSFNAIAGISGVADFTNHFETRPEVKQFSINYGILGGAEAEFVATRKMSFILAGTQRYYIRKDYGNLRFHLFAAIRLTL